MSDPRFVAIPLGQSQRFRGGVETNAARLVVAPSEREDRWEPTIRRHAFVCPHAHRKPESAIACAREWFLREGK